MQARSWRMLVAASRITEERDLNCPDYQLDRDACPARSHTQGKLHSHQTEAVQGGEKSHVPPVERRPQGPALCDYTREDRLAPAQTGESVGLFQDVAAWVQAWGKSRV